MKKSYTEQDKKQWIERYLKGETARSIAKDFPTSETTVARVIKAEGISRGKGKIYSKELIKEQVVKEYKDNKFISLTDLSKKYNLDPRTIKKWLTNYNISIKQHSGYITKCDINYFKQIDTPNKAYILGFITADGAVVAKTNKTTKSCSIEVHEKDVGVLKFIKKEINPEATLTYCNYRNKTNYRISLCSTELCNDLEKYGIIQNKSKILDKVPEDCIPKNLLPFYFRGLIDGDGSIGLDGKVSIYSGSLKFIQSVQNILCREAKIKQLKIYQGTTFFVSWSSKEDKEKLFKYLYSELNQTYYYPRKYKRLYNFLYDNTEVTN